MSHLNIHPHYAITMEPDAAKRQSVMREYRQPACIEIIDLTIPGCGDIADIPARIYRRRDVSGSPMILNIHGGGFDSGSYEIDNNRASYFAEHVPAVVVSPNYRLLPKDPFPAALLDCCHVWKWMYEHGKELGGDSARMGVFGTSAGGNLAAGMAFYIRDHGGPQIKLNALNMPVLGIGPTLSVEQMRYEAPVIRGDGISGGLNRYVGGRNGEPLSYYAVPNLADDFFGLPPTLVITAEYDPLRVYGAEYVHHLQRDHVPVEMYLMPRVGHSFDSYEKPPMTRWIHDGVVMSFQREFCLLEEI